ncbi:MAG: hypothetical protein PHW82_10270, partial [Bacteroidales bacterium]|nr:hypothetical protein [Bacteroidales bacterium]
SDYKIKQVIILKPNPPAFAHSAKLHEQKQGDKFINNVVKLYTYFFNIHVTSIFTNIIIKRQTDKRNYTYTTLLRFE